MDLPTIQAAYGSLKIASDLIKAALKLKSSPEITGKLTEANAAVISAQESAFAAQASQSAMIKRINDLEKEVTRIKA